MRQLRCKDFVYLSLILIATTAIIFSEFVIYTARVEPKVTTEIYFTNVKELNHSIAYGEPFYVNFTITTKDNVVSMYRYGIFANLYDNNNSLTDTLTLGGGSTEVRCGGGEKISNQVNISEDYNACLVRISIEIYKLGSSQAFEIHYWAIVIGGEK